MSNKDEKDNRRPCEMLIDRSFINERDQPGQTAQKNTLEDSDFSMNGGLIAFMRAKSLVDPETTPNPDGAEDDEMPPSAQNDPYPWMRGCGRNFKHSIFSLQPSRAPKRGLGRHRRGLSRGQHEQPAP